MSSGESCNLFVSSSSGQKVVTLGSQMRDQGNKQLQGQKEQASATMNGADLHKMIEGLQHVE